LGSYSYSFFNSSEGLFPASSLDYPWKIPSLEGHYSWGGFGLILGPLITSNVGGLNSGFLGKKT